MTKAPGQSRTRRSNYLTREDFHALPDIERRFHIQEGIRLSLDEFKGSEGYKGWDKLKQREQLKRAHGFMVKNWQKNVKNDGVRSDHPDDLLKDTGSRPMCPAYSAAGCAFLRRLGFDAKPIQVFWLPTAHVTIEAKTSKGPVQVDVANDMFDPKYGAYRVLPDDELQHIVIAQDQSINKGEKNNWARTERAYSDLVKLIGEPSPARPEYENVAATRYRVLLSNAILQGGDSERALGVLALAEHSAQDHPLTHGTLGSYLFSFAKLSETNPEDIGAKAAMTERAREHLEKACANGLGYARPKVLETLGDVLMAQDNPGVAEQRYHSAIVAGLDTAQIWFKKGSALLFTVGKGIGAGFLSPKSALPNLWDVKDCFDKAIERDASNPTYFHMRSKVKHGLGDASYISDKDRAKELYIAAGHPEHARLVDREFRELARF